MKDEDVLRVPGIVVRLIPEYTTSLYNYGGGPFKDNQELVNFNGRPMIKETNKNPLGGKYLVMTCVGQGSIVTFNKKYCGIGDTITEAYEDLMKKEAKR